MGKVLPCHWEEMNMFLRISVGGRTCTFFLLSSRHHLTTDHKATMMKVLFAAGLLALTKAQDDTPDVGTTGCPCLATPPIAGFIIPTGETGEGLLRARPNGADIIPYPVSYGTNCGAHDVATAPYCADTMGGSPLADDPATTNVTEAAPSWCASAWCWVDPNNCDTDNDPSSYFHEDNQAAVLHYSYNTCGHDNTFTDTELDAQACNEEHSDVVAEHCAGGIQADARCPCINWADDLDSRAPFENADGTFLIVPLGDNVTTTDVDESQDYEYVLGYGSGACAAHDATHAPYCSDANGTPLANAPDWCQSSWCWVDPANCVLADENGNAISAVASSYFHRDGEEAARYYSYETCQHDNTFSDSELDPQACNDEVGYKLFHLPARQEISDLTLFCPALRCGRGSLPICRKPRRSHDLPVHPNAGSAPVRDCQFGSSSR